MNFTYEPGQRIRLKGEFGGYPATVKKVKEELIVIHFDDLACPTTILKEHMLKLEAAGEVELVS